MRIGLAILFYLSAPVILFFGAVFSVPYTLTTFDWQPCYDHRGLWVMNATPDGIAEILVSIEGTGSSYHSLENDVELSLPLPSPIPTGSLSLSITLKNGTSREFRDIAVLSGLFDSPRIWVLTPDKLVRMMKLEGAIECGVISAWFDR